MIDIKAPTLAAVNTSGISVDRFYYIFLDLFIFWIFFGKPDTIDGEGDLQEFGYSSS